jgi:hypothetical protein
VATAVVLLCWGIAIAILLWSTDASLQEGKVYLFPPDEWTMRSPYGPERYATYDHELTVFADLTGALVFFSVLISISLAFVNGLVFLFRRRKFVGKRTQW